jgi:hypothetical protein
MTLPQPSYLYTYYIQLIGGGFTFEALPLSSYALSPLLETRIVEHPSVTSSDSFGCLQYTEIVLPLG